LLPAAAETRTHIHKHFRCLFDLDSVMKLAVFKFACVLSPSLIFHWIFKCSTTEKNSHLLI